MSHLLIKNTGMGWKKYVDQFTEYTIDENTLTCSGYLTCSEITNMQGQQYIEGNPRKCLVTLPLDAIRDL